MTCRRGVAGLVGFQSELVLVCLSITGYRIMAHAAPRYYQDEGLGGRQHSEWVQKI